MFTHEVQLAIVFENLAKSSPGSNYLTDNFANVYSELGMAYAALGSDVRLPRDVRRKHWSQSRLWYRKSLEVWLELQRQGKVLSEYAGEPDRISKEIDDCTQALGHLQ
jgi:hypothetical protein